MAKWDLLKIGGTMGRLFSIEGKYYPWLLLPATVVAAVLVLAEENDDFVAAQASLVTILLCWR